MITEIGGHYRIFDWSTQTLMNHNVLLELNLKTPSIHFLKGFLHHLCVFLTISSLEFPLMCYGKFLVYILVGPVCRVGSEKKSSHNLSARTELSMEIMGVVIRLY
jgi:hypothetical protein